MMHWRLLCSALFHAALGCSAYYHMSPLNQIQKEIVSFSNRSIYKHYGVVLSAAGMAWLWASIATSVNIGAVCGAFVLKYPLEIWGRRNTIMLLKNAIQIAGSLLQLLAKPTDSVELLLLGRLVAGVSIGMAMCIPVFLTECAPVQHRGFVATVAYLGTPFWTIIGSVVGMPQVLGKVDSWHYVLLLAAIPAVLHAACTPLFPDSPKFLFITRRDRSAAVKALRFYHGPDANLEAALGDFEREAEMVQNEEKQSASIKEILTTRHLAWPFWLCMVVNVGQDLGGTDLAFQYSSGFMQLLGISGDMSSVFTVTVTQVPGLFICMLGLFLVERRGRRLLVLLGIGLGVLAMTLVFIAGLLPKDSKPGSILGIVGLFLSISGYYIGPAFIAGLLPGEICPQNSRSLTSGIAFASSWFPVVIIVLFYPPLQLAIGSYSVLPLVVLGIGAFGFLYVYLPETKGLPVHQVVKRWRKDETEDEKAILKQKLDAISYGSVE